MTHSEFIRLVRDVFISEPGSTLLAVLEKRVMTPKPGQSLYEESTNAMYFKAGQMDLIRQLKDFVSLKPGDLKKLKDQEKPNPEDLL